MIGYYHTSNKLYTIEILGNVKSIKDNWLYYFLDIKTPVDLEKALYDTDKYRIVESIDINNNISILTDDITIYENVSFYKNKTQALDNFLVEYYFEKTKNGYVKKENIDINFSGKMTHWTCIGTIDAEFNHVNGIISL